MTSSRGGVPFSRDGGASRPAAAARKPARPSVPRRVAGAAWQVGGWAGRIAVRRPIPVLLAVFLGAGGSLIGWNALMTQTGRHPAPLFATKPSAPEPVRGLAAAPPPRQDPAPAPVAAAPAAPAPLPVRRPAPATLATPAPDPARTASTDPIGALIRTGDVARATETRPTAGPARIASAQKALSKLGYGPLKADGLFGATTRQALERFERDKNLPVTGTVAGRTARQLAALSGVAIE